MEQNKTPFSELSVIDDYLSFVLAANPKYNKACFKRILSVLLEREIQDVEIFAQHAIPGNTSEYRGIRLDIEIHESEESNLINIYDLEPQKRKGIDFPLHNRFYTAKVDSLYVKSGEKTIRNLPNLYVITITDYDIFGMGSRIYTFEHTCKEYPDDVPYNDKIKYIYYNTAGKTGCSQSVQNMLNYICSSDEAHVVDEATLEIHSYVSEAKKDPRLEANYMTLGEAMYYDGLEIQADSIKKYVKRVKDFKSVEVMTQELYEDYPDLRKSISDLIKEAIAE